jgi:hypothetical protein
MITESFQSYKGYIIRLRAVTGNGFWYAIIKEVPNEASPNGIKKLYLRQKGWNFIEPEVLLQKAKDYIDNHAANLDTRIFLKYLHEDKPMKG